MLKRETGERIYDIRQELRDVMDLNFGIFRTLEQMEYALKKIREMRSRFAKARMEDEQPSLQHGPSFRSRTRKHA